VYDDNGVDEGDEYKNDNFNGEDEGKCERDSVGVRLMIDTVGNCDVDGVICTDDDADAYIVDTVTVNTYESVVDDNNGMLFVLTVTIDDDDSVIPHGADVDLITHDHKYVYDDEDDEGGKFGSYADEASKMNDEDVTDTLRSPPAIDTIIDFVRVLTVSDCEFDC
jgi:hypothetical protein